MNRIRFARCAGFVALAGAVIQLLYGFLAIRFPYAPGIYYGWDEALWLVATLGMFGGTAGLLALDVGRPRWLAIGSGGAVILGSLVRLAASGLIITRAAWDPLGLILASIVLVLVGMAVLGITTLRGGRLIGWQAWTPLLVSIFGFITTALFSISLFAHFILLGMWGITWLLVGFVVINNASPHGQEDSAYGSGGAVRTMAVGPE